MRQGGLFYILTPCSHLFYNKRLRKVIQVIQVILGTRIKLIRRVCMPRAIRGYKTCSSCGINKPVSEFWRQSKCADGLNTQCKDCLRANHRRWYLNADNRAKSIERSKNRRRMNRDLERQQTRARWIKLRDQVLLHYSFGLTVSCVCCAGTEKLGIDHIQGGGKTHLIQLGLFNLTQDVRRFYSWLRSEGYPPGYQTLCRECSSSKGTGVRCRIHNKDFSKDLPEILDKKTSGVVK